MNSTYVVRARSRRWTVGALLGGLLVAGCSGVPGTVTPAPPLSSAPAADRAGEGGPGQRGAHHPLDEATVSAFVADLNDALGSGDVEEWMRLLALDKEGSAQQREWYAGVHAVPMDVRQIVATSVLGDDPGRGQYVDVAFRHQVVGADAVPSLEYYRLTVHQDGEGGDLRVVRVRGQDGYFSAYPQAWDLGPLRVHDGEALVLLGAPEVMARAEAVLPALEEAARSTLEEFPVDGVERMVVTLVEEEDLVSLYGDLHGDDPEAGELAGFMALAGGAPVADPGTVTDPVDRDTATARIVLEAGFVDEEAAYYGDVDGGSPLLRHEGLHLVMALGAPDAWGPEWGFEGMATWWESVGDPSATDDLYAWSAWLSEDAGVEPAWPPSDYEEFFEGDIDEVDRHYADAGLVFLYLEQEFGRDVAVQIGTDLHRIEGYDIDRLVDEVLQEHLWLTQPELQADWEAWVADLPSQ